MSVSFRRLVRLAFLGALGAVVATWFRNRLPEETPAAEPGSAAWPPLRPLAEPSDGAPAEPAPTRAPARPLAVVDALVDASAWMDPDDAGACPLTHPVKVKQSSGIYHVPGGQAYERTRADRCYRSSDDAEADGFRASKI